MSWKFWKKEPVAGEPSQAKGEKLPGPKDIPEPVGRNLVVKLGKDPDWVWSLKGVVRRRPEGKHAYDVRVFDMNNAAAKKVRIKNYTSLDGHPELILFEGWFDKKTMQVEIKEAK
jgi:hypothetical protein